MARPASSVLAALGAVMPAPKAVRQRGDLVLINQRRRHAFCAPLGQGHIGVEGADVVRVAR